MALSLTWDGQELLNEIRSETVWEKIKERVADKGINLSIDTLRDLAKATVTPERI